MDSLELKVPEEEPDEYLRKVRAMSQADKPPKVARASGESFPGCTSHKEMTF